MLRSSLLIAHDFVHGFTVRSGEEKLPGRLFQVTQVHGCEVVAVGQGDAPEGVKGREADALVATRAGDAVGVRVADCVPVLFGDTRSGAVAAAHAGWRGCVAGVLAGTLEALGREAGARPEDVVVAIGPHIRAEAFEVGEEVAAEIAGAAHGVDVVVRGYDKPHVDLSRVVRAQLEAAGIGPDRIDDVGGCTLSEPERFHSYRRDGKRAGRHLGVIQTRR